MQQLITEPSKKGLYCPFLDGGIHKNLKRSGQWNSVEVHAIYDLVYTLCMSKEGFKLFCNYFSAKDTEVHEPLFMAQYMLAPANTIVKNTLLN